MAGVDRQPRRRQAAFDGANMAQAGIPKYRYAQVLIGEKLREYRTYVKQVKDLGLVKTPVKTSLASPFGKGKGPRGGEVKIVDVINRNRDKLTPYVSPESRRIKVASPLSVRNLPGKPQSLAATLKDLTENADAINALKKPRERFAFQVGDIRSYYTFSDIRLMADFLGESAGIQQVLRKRSQSQELFSALKIVRWNRDVRFWKPDKQKLTPAQLKVYRARKSRDQAKSKAKRKAGKKK